MYLNPFQMGQIQLGHPPPLSPTVPSPQGTGFGRAIKAPIRSPVPGPLPRHRLPLAARPS